MDTPLLDHCPPTLPRAAYIDPGWFAQEMQAIWSRDWICAGRVDQFATGNIRRISIAGQSIIVLRDGERLRAFHNICRHRGAELCAHDDTPQRGRLVTCPYHAWAYASDGRLISTAHGTPTADFHKEDHGLLPVASREWNGFLFLSLAADPGPLEPDMGLSSLDHWPMDRLVVGHVMEKRLACNWKIFWENYNECLHCPGIHPELCDMVPIYTKGIMAISEDPSWDGETVQVLKAGAETWSMTGKPCGPIFEDLTPEERIEGHRFVTFWPTTFVVAHVDYVRFVTLTPISAEETELRATWLFLPETLAQPGFDHRTVTDFATTVMLQDGDACEMNQRGIRSPAYTRGTLMPQEFDIARFHAWVMDRLQGAAS